MQMKFKNTLVLIVAGLVVTACGGGSSGGSSGNNGVATQDDATITAVNATNSLNVMEAKSLSLQQSVATSDDKTAYIKSIEPLNDFTKNKCETKVDSLSMNIESFSLGVCAYKYTVALASDDLKESSAISFSSVQGEEGGSSLTLTPIGLAMGLAESVTLDLEYELGNSFPTTSVLDASSLIIVGDDDTQVVADATNNEMSITTSHNQGHTRIYYTMVDSTADLAYQGVIDVAVNTTSAAAPIAEDFKLEEQVQSEQTTIIDVSDYVSDADGDELKLEKVITFDAQAELIEGENTKFEFTGVGLGERSITYVISDQTGGYAIGTITISLTGGAGAVEVTWSDIIVTDNTISHDITFTAPLSTEFADLLKVSYGGEYTEDGITGGNGYKIAIMSYRQAEQFCSYKGARLPTTRELKLLNADSGNLFENKGWPTGEVYWSAISASETESDTYDFNSETEGTLGNILNKANVTCVMLDGTVNDFEMERINADSRLDDVTEYSTTVTDPDGSPAAYKQVYLSTKSQNGVFGSDSESNLLEASLLTDSSGNVEFSYTEVREMNDIIQSEFSSSELNTIYKTADEFRTVNVDVHNPDVWNRVAMAGDLADHDNGLPLFGNGATETSNIYKYPFNALEWEIYYVTEGSGTSNGYYTIYVIQETNTPSSNWGDRLDEEDGVMAGSPDTDDSLSRSYTVNTNRYGSAPKAGIGYYLAYDPYKFSGTWYNRGEEKYYSSGITSLVKNKVVYQWFERYINSYGNPKIRYYISTTPDKSEATKVFDVLMSDYLSVNPFGDLYVGFGGKSGSTNLDVIELKISTYE